MPIHLMTGTPGAGKTLYSLSVLVPRLMSDLVQDGQPLKRRLVVGGVRDLLLDHEQMDVPRIRDWDAYRKTPEVQAFAGLSRFPGEPPLPVPYRADNWHLWCRPGDVIVIDEAQHCFRTAASGLAVPAFITNLEEHRHFGVDFLLITQHPQLLHQNVRALVNPHRHIRRIWGRAQCLVYEWDRCSPINSVSSASTTRWAHSKKHFGIYKSAEIHTKFSQRIPAVALFAVAAVAAVPLLGWQAWARTQERLNPAITPAPPGPAVTASDVALVASSLSPWPQGLEGCFASQNQCVCIKQVGPGAYSYRPTRFEVCQSVVIGDLVKPPSAYAPASSQKVASVSPASASAPPATRHEIPPAQASPPTVSSFLP